MQGIWCCKSLLLQPRNLAVRCISNSSVLSKYWMVQYQYVNDVVNKRAPFREAHLTMARKYRDEGKLLFGGAFADPVDSAAIVFKTDNKKEVEDFVLNDPYVKSGIVTKYAIREWTVVVEREK